MAITNRINFRNTKGDVLGGLTAAVVRRRPDCAEPRREGGAGCGQRSGAAVSPQRADDFWGGQGDFAEHNAISNYDVLIVDLSEVPVLGVTSALAIENAIEEAIDEGREVRVIGANTKVKGRLEKLGIAGIIPKDHWMDDRLLALNKGLAISQQKLFPATDLVVPQDLEVEV